MMIMAAKRVAILTSGGDAPGMNAALRAAVRSGIAHGLEVLGVEDGYVGLIRGAFQPLGLRSVGGIVQRGGTVLGTSRCDEMRTAEGVDLAIEQMRRREVDALIVIGGNGSQSGAFALSRRGWPVVGIASTIDNDLYGTDISIGATTAVDTALDALDRLRVTAASHRRAFLVEVMGRHCGYLALMAGIAGGAEAIVTPEDDTMQPEDIARELLEASERGKRHAIVVIAEGARHDAEGLASYFKAHEQRLGFDLRVSKLGHIQRGGSPCAFDRMLATRLGVGASEALAAGTHGVLIGLIDGAVASTPLVDVANRSRPAERRWIELARMLAA